MVKLAPEPILDFERIFNVTTPVIEFTVELVTVCVKYSFAAKFTKHCTKLEPIVGSKGILAKTTLIAGELASSVATRPSIVDLTVF